jgi:hypothetical protein
MMVRAPRAVDLLAKSDNPPHHAPNRPCNWPASQVRLGSPEPASREQTANADFANSVSTFDEVKHTYCRKAVYATSASLLMRRVTTTPFSSHW